MSKPEWGTKRICLECGEHFYDLGKDPIECPHCGEKMSVEEFLKQQMQNAGKSKRGGKGKIHEEPEVVATEEADFGDADDEMMEIEDASDLGDDDHDMAEVMDNVEKVEE